VPDDRVNISPLSTVPVMVGTAVFSANGSEAPLPKTIKLIPDIKQDFL
jgi:hypothetical protein